MSKTKQWIIWGLIAAAMVCWSATTIAVAVAQEAARADWEGTAVYHSPHNLYYQASSHQVAYNPKTFVLIPVDTYEENWEPSTKQWSGRSEANYLVAYCSDDRTSSTTQGTAYQVYTLDNSRFSDDVQRRKVAAIIGHSYPFLTAEEMRAGLAAAVEAGSLSEEVLDCGESEWIAATQWAIWSTTATTGQITVEDVAGAAFPDGHPENYINPLENVGHTDEETIKNHVEALKVWLCSLEAPEALAVVGHDHAIVQEESGSYTLQVQVTLNRAVEPGEEATFSLQVGSSRGEAQTVPVGETVFSVGMTGLTAEEIADSRVELTLSGEHMQAYFYDSANYQDMVGGSWESYCHDLSFTLGLEKICVAVSKVWTEETPGAESVTVQLLADGKPHGSAVRLHEGNNWSYTWRELWKTDVLGKEIAYTVREAPVEGFYGRLEQVDNYTASMPVWQEKDTFDGAGEYVIVSAFGALQATRYTDAQGAGKNDYITLAPIDLTCGSRMPESLIWQAEPTAEGSYTLHSPFVGKGIYMSSYGYLAATPSALGFNDGHLYRQVGGTRRYFSGFYSNEAFCVSADESVAMNFRLYKLEQQVLPLADINFLLTNSRTEEVAEITVSKVWAGRQDGVYPEKAEVVLLQDGRVYQRVQLSAENGWRYTWPELPVKADGKLIEYTVEEPPLKGYDTQVRRDSEYSWSYTVVNTWEGIPVQIKLMKTDSDDAGKMLSGAEFTLYHVSRSQEGVEIPLSGGVRGFAVGTVVTGEDGTAEMTVSLDEQYYLVETVAPAGYNLPEKAVGFSVSSGKKGTTVLTLIAGETQAEAQGDTLRLSNCVGVSLPQTGGKGSGIYIAMGTVMVFIAALAACHRRRI